MNPQPEKPAANSIGLCLTCTHSRQIQSDRGSIFFLCKLSETDPAFPKYPRLPVLSCHGYSPGSAESGA